MLLRNDHSCFLQNVKAIPVESQHMLVVTDKSKIMSVVRIHLERRKISLLSDEVGKWFKEKATELLFDIGVQD